MPGTFAEVRDELVAGVLNSHPSTSSLIAAAMVRQLANLQPEAVPFMEVTGSFSTGAGVNSYTSTTAGFPKSLLRFDRLWYDMGQSARFLEIVDADTIRYLQEQSSQAYPTRVTWYEEKLQFGPAPSAVYVVKWAAILDSTKNTADGAAITATTGASTQTNAWLTTGVVPFKHLVWADYYMTSPDQRPDLAASHGNLASVALERLHEAARKRQEMNTVLVTPNAFDGYRGASSARIQAIFPGAPI